MARRSRCAMALAPLDPLARVVAARPAGLGGLHRLAVDDARCGFGLAAFRDPRACHQHCIDRVEQAAVAHPVDMILHRRERREVLGRLRPLTSRRGEVLDRVPQIPCPVKAWAPHLRGRCQQRRDQRSFFIGAITCVTQPASVMLAPSGFGPAHVVPVVFATLGESKTTEIDQPNFRLGSKPSPETESRRICRRH